MRIYFYWLDVFRNMKNYYVIKGAEIHIFDFAKKKTSYIRPEKTPIFAPKYLLII